MTRKLLALFIYLILAAFVCLPQTQASSQVRMAQQRLESKGFDPGPIDGKWGPKTSSALKDFQRARDLEVTGRLNANTKEALGLSGNNRSIEVVGVETSSGNKVDLYNQSYALLVGVSDYKGGWPSLNQVNSEVDKVQETLSKQGFQVRKVLNPDDEELENAFEDFIDDYAYDKSNRLLFYYAGHGHTLNDGKDGYLVPTNAPDPRQDKIDFERKALDMNLVLAWCRQMNAKHALFLFDSCFSGTIFKQRDLPDTPPRIKELTSKPVRQFITAGQAEESVPADSTFTPVFIDALKYGLGDLNEDGYISGTELGLYLQKKVPQHTQQTPQYGTIQDYELSRGDFVFLAGGSAVVSEPQPEEQQRESRQTGSLQVDTEPNRAKIYVNGEYKGRSPQSFEALSLGPTKVRATKDGYSEQKRSVYIRSDRQMQVTLILDAIETTGALKVQSQPQGAKWYLDGAFAGKTPDTMESVEEGQHRIKVVKEGFQDWTTQARIEAGAKERVDAELEPTRQEPEPGDTWTEPTTGMEFAWVPGGCYQMGCGSWTDNCDDDEKPVHEVCVDGFWIGKYEVTQGQWQEIMGSNPSDFDRGDNHPVENVSWNDCQDFIDELNSKSDKNFRLPTEAEWEYAARSGGLPKKYAGVDNVDSVAWYGENSDGQTHEVGTKAPNGLGIHDMSGNVWEWCRDWYSKDYYSKSPKNNPHGPSSGEWRLHRGGSWYDGSRGVRTLIRHWGSPDMKVNNLGFRLCLPQSGD